mgnify:CR=1 FL=1
MASILNLDIKNLFSRKKKSDSPDEEIIPNPDNVGSSLGTGLSKLDQSFDPSNFLKTKSFGVAPSNTTLTIKYAHGGGIDDNVPAGDITNVSSVSYQIQDSLLNSSTVQEIL